MTPKTPAGRGISTFDRYLILADEVRSALDASAPVVALETSVLAQGLPFPKNVEAASACLSSIRRAGAIPATIGILGGKIRIGLDLQEIERLAAPGSKALKVGSSDLAMAIAQGADGGTTVSATCEIAWRAGIRFFATGGIGGVHRGAAESFDISQDVWALSRFGVAVVSAGAKIVLDLPKTVEALESAGVPIIGFNTVEFPAFYSAQSKIRLAWSVSSVDQAAALAALRFQLGQGGILFVQPPPAERAFAFEEVDALVQRAVAEARAQGVSGKALTPFLLRFLSQATGGRTVDLNIQLLVENAALAARLARAFATVESEL